MALAGAAEAQPAPQPLSLLDVPFISQSEALCGGAAAAMVLRYWGAREVDAESFAHLVDRSAAGIRTTALVAELRGRGWNAIALSGSRDRIAGELSRGRPVLTLIEDRAGTYHYIVIVAATDTAVVFHDPARAPLRVMNRDEFDRRWSAAGRWMAIIVPAVDPPEPVRPDTPLGPSPATACEALVAEGIARAQANDLAAAERNLTMALTCPGAAAWRELAGVRLLQRRWPDVTELASAAIAIEPRDEYSWRLLGTSRFVQNDPLGALDAWNRIGEPRIDLMTVTGLTRTRQRDVERLAGIRRSSVLTTATFIRARRRLDELPSAFSTRLEYAPVPSALAELRAIVNERPPLPSDVWSYAAIGLTAAANREVAIATGSVAGGGESIAARWRFWPERPRVSVGVRSPAPWGGIWGVEGSSTRDTFDREGMSRAERVEGGLTVSEWVSAPVRMTLRGGITRWEGLGTYGALGASTRLLTPGEHVQIDGSVDFWSGHEAFSVAAGRLTARSSPARRGRVLVARGGFGVASRGLPPDLWFAGDTGQARDVLLRAHPVLQDGRLVTAQLGRRIVHASLEGQQWWRVAVAGVAAAAFVDAARVNHRLDPAALGHVDVGFGGRIALPGVRGVFRADVARGLRDGATTFSFVYDP